MIRITKATIVVAIQVFLAWALVMFVAGPLLRNEPFFWQNDPGTGMGPEEGVQAELGPMLPIEEVLVNVAGTKGRRFFKTSFQLEMQGDDIEKSAPERAPVLRSRTIELLSTKSLDQLTSLGARDSLKLELLETLNAEVSGGRFTDVFFTEFLVH